MSEATDKKILELLSRIDSLLPPSSGSTDWKCPAFRWRRHRYLGMEAGVLEPITRVAFVRSENICNVDRQKNILLANTEQFVKGLPANNVLLTGARGTGKSSLIRAALTKFFDQGLRLIEVDKEDLTDLGEIATLVGDRPERFIIFCDDLSFEMGEGSYKALKAVLDGSVAASSENMLVYSTSNRRHLMPETMNDNLSSTHSDAGDLHPAESVEEKMSLSERFGLWLSFYPFSQEEYLNSASQCSTYFGAPAGTETWRVEALQFAMQRGSRSGRVAYQFARDWAGWKGLGRV